MGKVRIGVGSVVVALLATVCSLGSTSATVDRVVPASGASPYAPGCNGAKQSGRVYPGGEVEPYLGVNPTRKRNLIGVWQQDRWSTGGANGILARISTDGGRSWQHSVSPPFSHCAGGSARNGGDYERASDPWVSFAPNGDAYFMSLSINDSNPTNAMLLARSRDGGRTWGPIHTLIKDGAAGFNDKNSITADPADSRYAYAVWDRLSTDANGRSIGPSYFTRTTNGGASWERARPIYDPGPGSQTIANQVVVTPDGTLLDLATVILNGDLNVAVLRSTDRGQHWSQPVFVDGLGTVGVVDPRDGAPVRTGDIVPEIAVDPRPGRDNVYAVWQDARFTGGQADQIAFARSTDGGRHWSPAKRVSAPGNTQAFNAQVHVDARGRVAVTYYDFSADTTADTPLRTDVWVRRSADGGRHFGVRERLTQQSFDLRRAPDAGGFFVGDYTGLDAEGSVFHPLFVTTGTPAGSGPTDAYSARVYGPAASAVSPAVPAQQAPPPKVSSRAMGKVPAGQPVTRH